jgi:hypothetical protein
MGVFTLKKLNSEGRNLKKNQNGKFITQCEKESIGHIGDNPLFISSIVCGRFITFSNSVSLWLRYGADVSAVSVPDSFDVWNCAFLLFNSLCDPRYNFGGFYHPQCDTSVLFVSIVSLRWKTEQVEVWPHLKYTCVLWSPMDTCGYSSAGHNSQVNWLLHTSPCRWIDYIFTPLLMQTLPHYSPDTRKFPMSIRL